VLSEVLKTPRTDPSVLIRGAVTFVEHVGHILDHELCATELAMIVIPRRIARISFVVAMRKRDTLQVSLLTLKPPIIRNDQVKAAAERPSSAAAGATEPTHRESRHAPAVCCSAWFGVWAMPGG
jgi:hypothetical protein